MSTLVLALLAAAIGSPGASADVAVAGVSGAEVGALAVRHSVDREVRLPTATDSLPVQVRVEGVRGEMRSNVMASLRLAREAREGRALSRGEVDRLHARSPDQIRRALEPFGHYRPEIQAELTTERDSWRATYRIIPGEAVTVTRMDVRIVGPGAGDPALEEAVEGFLLQPGAPFRHPTWEQAKRRLQAAAVESGYLDAVFRDRRVVVDPDRGTAEVALSLETGERFRFGSVRFIGHDLDPGFLQGFIRFRPGEPLSMPVLLELQNSLQATGLFSSVEVELRRGEEADLQVPVEVRLAPRPRRRYDGGVGYGTDTGPRAVVSGELRRLNSVGHGLVGEARASMIQNGLNLSYVIPLPGVAGNRLGFTGGFLDERTLDVRSTRATLGMGWHRGRGTWREVWLVDLQRERSGQDDEVRTATTLVPSVHWVRTGFDDPVYATRGHRLRLELAGAHRGLISDISFGKVALRAGAIFSPWDEGRVLLRGEVGAALVDDVANLPVSFRFYAGGDRSVRGYAYRSLAPTSPEGTPLGGRHLLVTSAEVEQMFWRGFGVAVFVDAGNASRDWPVRPQVGTGAGLRWRSPVGMVRVDGAAAVSRSGTPWRLHLSVGPSL